MALRHRVEFDAAVFCSGNLQQGHRAFVEDERIGIVVHNHYIVGTGELHQPHVCLASGVSSGRHVGIVCPHQLHSGEVHAFQFLKIGLPGIVLTQIVIHYLRTENLAQ